MCDITLLLAAAVSDDVFQGPCYRSPEGAPAFVAAKRPIPTLSPFHDLEHLCAPMIKLESRSEKRDSPVFKGYDVEDLRAATTC